jgi:adenine-specific DNA-methyltransferase
MCLVSRGVILSRLLLRDPFGCGEPAQQPAELLPPSGPRGGTPTAPPAADAPTRSPPLRGRSQHGGRDAHRGIGFDLLLVCGFAFDPHVAEEGKVIEKQVGRLKVLLLRMNPDLAMGDNLSKKTGAGNLFLVFGEPDVALERQKDGRYVAEVRGVDVFDPTTGKVRSSGPEDIACWFLDTDYNGESFFVRQAYFLGGQEPYEKLKRALRAEVDEAEWSKLCAARSVPFEAPKRGKVAVKVINHYGDEVPKVYATGK